MIESFASAETERLFETKNSRRLSPKILKSALMRLTQPHAAVEVDDLRMPPSNRLEALTSDLAGKWSIHVNDRWRLYFRFGHGHAYDVAMLDYHLGVTKMTAKNPVDGLPAIHPGEILRETLQDLAMTRSAFADAIGVSPMRVSHLLKGDCPVTAKLALRLGRALGQPPQRWLNLQSAYDLKLAQIEMKDSLKDVRILAGA